MDFHIIQKDSVPVCPVDASGCFTAEVADFAGQYVKVSGPGDSQLLLLKYNFCMVEAFFSFSMQACFQCVTGICIN